MKPFIVAAIFVAALTVVLWVAVTSASIPVLKLRTLRTAYTGGYVRVDDGKIKEIESIDPLRFTVGTEGDLGGHLIVESKRTVPENFKTGVDVGLEGHYDPKRGVFTAERISTQCPSKYEATRAAAEAEAGAYGEKKGAPGMAGQGERTPFSGGGGRPTASPVQSGS